VVLLEDRFPPTDVGVPWLGPPTGCLTALVTFSTLEGIRHFDDFSGFQAVSGIEPLVRPGRFRRRSVANIEERVKFGFHKPDFQSPSYRKKPHPHINGKSTLFGRTRKKLNGGYRQRGANPRTSWPPCQTPQTDRALQMKPTFFYDMNDEAISSAKMPESQLFVTPRAATFTKQTVGPWPRRGAF